MNLHYFNKRNLKRKSQNRSLFAVREITSLFNRLDVNKLVTKSSEPIFVDLGCGDKFLEPEVRRRGFKYFGFDIDNIDLTQDDIPISDDSVDIAVCYSVLEHLIDPTKMLLETYRILKRGGVLVIETPNWHYSTKTFFDDYTHIKPYTPSSIGSLLSDFEFKLIEIVPNLRCKPNILYVNKLRFWVAANLPFTGFGGFWGFMKGRSRGLFVIAQKRIDR